MFRYSFLCLQQHSPIILNTLDKITKLILRFIQNSMYLSHTMPQQVLTDFYTRNGPPKSGSFHDFIYDPENGEATFVDSNPRAYTLVRSIDRIRLWVKSNNLLPFEKIKPQPNFQRLIPLLKSHLQKAIRRQNTDSALSTAYTLILFDKSSLVRRLPIIAIEDVELITGTSVIVWLMMAGDSYTWCKEDVSQVLAYVERLCSTKTYLIREGSEVTISHSLLATIEEDETRNEMLALYYRMKWGGTSGDVRMLEQALQTYYNNKICMQKTNIPLRASDLPLPEILDLDLQNPQFIPEAIDFHCFPNILKKISEISCIPTDRVKELIWYCQSAVNTRKQHTIEKSSKYQLTRDYKRVSQCIGKIREALLERLSLTVGHSY